MIDLEDAATRRLALPVAIGFAVFVVLLLLPGFGLLSCVSIAVLVALLSVAYRKFNESGQVDAVVPPSEAAPQSSTEGVSRGAGIPAPQPEAPTSVAAQGAVDLTPDPMPEPVPDPMPQPTTQNAGEKADLSPPEGLSAARDGGGDDLTRIKGVGPKMQAMLNSMGFYHFDQIANWSPDKVRWVDDNLDGFKGRVTRDDWVRQARELKTD